MNAGRVNRTNAGPDKELAAGGLCGTTQHEGAWRCVAACWGMQIGGGLDLTEPWALENRKIPSGPAGC